MMTSIESEEFPVVAQGIGKRYGKKEVLSNVAFAVRQGDRVVLLGRNGAGKTTTLRILLGLAKPTSGLVTLYGASPRSVAALANVGYCPQSTSAPAALRVREIVRLVAELKGVPEPIDLYAAFGIEHLLQRQIGGLSDGNARLVTTLLAFVGKPPLVILDEPTASLDAEHRHAVWSHAAEYSRAGGTLILASHDFSEVNELADRVLLLHDGRLIGDGALSGLADLADVAAVEVTCVISNTVPGTLRVLRTPSRSILLTRDPEKVMNFVRHATNDTIMRRQATLEEIFLVVGRE